MCLRLDHIRPPLPLFISLNPSEGSDASSADFLQTAHALTIYHSMATNAMQATSAQLSAINAAMLHTQDATREHLKKNQLDADTLDLTEYSAIAHILGMDRDAINPMGNVLNFPPSFASVPKPAETKAKRERKPKVPRDPNAPKRPLTGYLFYYTENKDALHARLNKEAGGDVPKGKVQEEGKNVWNAMPEAEKEVRRAFPHLRPSHLALTMSMLVVESALSGQMGRVSARAQRVPGQGRSRRSRASGRASRPSRQRRRGGGGRRGRRGGGRSQGVCRSRESG